MNGRKCVLGLAESFVCHIIIRITGNAEKIACGRGIARLYFVKRMMILGDKYPISTKQVFKLFQILDDVVEHAPGLSPSLSIKVNQQRHRGRQFQKGTHCLLYFII